MWFLYQLLMGCSLALVAPWLLLRRGGHYLKTLPGRLGGYRGEAQRGGLWIHAVSVGEVGVAATFARRLPESLPLVVTTVTPTGQSQARAAFGRRASVAYLPFDLGWPVGRFLARFAPRALVLVEGDYWPLVLQRAAREGISVGVINGRVGQTSFRRMRRLRRCVGPLFQPIALFGMQTEEDRGRLLELGVDANRVTATGNLKYETPEPDPLPELEARLRSLAGGRPLLLAGSTMMGEEEQVLDAFATLGGGERALLVLVPRHPERWDRVAQLVESRELSLLRRSALDKGGLHSSSPPVEPPAVLLLDSLGELAALYRAADIAFIGGTLVPTGGHNPLESARFAIPTVVGASMHNFKQIAAHFDAAEAWCQVKDSEGLAEIWDRWLREPEVAAEVGRRGAALIAGNRGALEKTLAHLAPILDPFDAHGGPS